MNTADKIRMWIKALEEATEYDPDTGDPYLCLDDVRNIIEVMKEWKES